MKKMLSLVLALALTLVFVACTKQLNNASTTTEFLPFEGNVYADLFEFETDDNWTYSSDENGRFGIWFNFSPTSDYIAGDLIWAGTFSFSLMEFHLPKRLYEDTNYLTEEMAIEWTDALAEREEVEITFFQFSETVVDGRPVWVIELEQQRDGIVVKSIFWYYIKEDSDLVYTWGYSGTPEEFEEYLPEAYAFIDSIRFI
jgi:hypothetical protein